MLSFFFFFFNYMKGMLLFLLILTMRIEYIFYNLEIKYSRNITQSVCEKMDALGPLQK